MDKILLVNQSSGYLMLDIVNEFVLSGKYSKVELFTGQINIRPTVPHKRVKIIKTLKYNKSNFIFRFISWFVATIHLFFLITFLKRGYKVFYVTNPPLTTFLPLFTKNKFSFLIYDLYPDTIVSQGFIKETRLIVKLWKKVNNIVFNKAERVFTISEDMGRNLSKYVDERKISAVSNWAHNEHIKPISKKENIFLKQFNISDKFIVLYSGNMGFAHDIDILVDVAAYMKDQEIMFLFIGEGAKKRLIEQKIENYKLKNCLVLPFQELEILPYSFGGADLSVITTDNSQTGLSVPSKTYSHLAAGSAILSISDKDSELSKFINENRVGSCFNSNEIKEIKDFINSLISQEELLREYKKNSRNLSNEYTPENAKEYIW